MTIQGSRAMQNVRTLTTLAFYSIFLTSCSTNRAGDEDGGSNSQGHATDDTNNETDDAGDTADSDEPPSCTPREELPDPVEPTIQMPTNCGLETSCGGDPLGTWHFVDVCIPAPDFLRSAYSRCSTATLSHLGATTLSGTVELDGATMSRSLAIEVEASLSFPNGCHGCRCTDLEDDLQKTGLDASCNPVCSGGACFCSIDKTVDYSFSEGYSFDGNQVLTDSGRSFEFCVHSGKINLKETTQTGAMPGSATLYSGDLFFTPEICDGIDNDGNGIEDDMPQDCPPECNKAGVCGEGVTNFCDGSSGWRCFYTSPHHESVERTCDQLDNDCDGAIDDLEECIEVCDGKDNDANGTFDDNLTDEPECPTGLGVCKLGASASCDGEEGWSCAFTSPDYQDLELTCDGLDNDCDGMTDEGCSCHTGATKLYYAWYNKSSIMSTMNLDGTNQEEVMTDIGYQLFDLAINPLDNMIYWDNFNAKKIEGSKLDGTGRVVLLDSWSAKNLRIDPGERYLYFINSAIQESCTGLCRISIDDPSDIVELAGGRVQQLALDLKDRKIYFDAILDREEDAYLQMINMDGTDRETLAQLEGSYLSGLTIDPVERKLYWSFNQQYSSISRANMDGSDVETVTRADYPTHLTLDPLGRKLYWVESSNDRIAWIDLDGTGTVSHVAIDNPYALTLYRCIP